MKNKLAELVGWAGTILIILTYASVSFGVISANSVIYQVLNFAAALGIFIVCWVKKAYQPVVTNLFWMAIAFFALLKIFKII